MTNPPSDRSPARWVLGLGIAAMLVPLNSIMIAVALPDIADDFGIDKGTTGLLITVYLIVMLVGQPIAGRLADSVGSRRLVLGALIGFAACSIASAFASNLEFLLVGRASQAIFGAALMPGTRALIRLVTSEARRGQSFGIQESLIGVGAAGGPLVGGLATQFAGWNGVLLVNVPVAMVALVLLRDVPTGEVSRHDRPGDGSPMAAVLTERSFVLPFVTQAAAVLAQYSLLLTVPIVLDGRGWSSTAIGAALMLLTVGIVVMGPVGGRLGDTHGRRLPVLTGILLAGAGMALATAAVDSSSALLLVAVTMFGFGFGFAVPNLTTSALEAVPSHIAGSAAGVWSMSRYVGSIPASLLFAVLVSDNTGSAQTLLLVACGSIAVAVLPASRLRTARKR